MSDTSNTPPAPEIPTDSRSQAVIAAFMVVGAVIIAVVALVVGHLSSGGASEACYVIAGGVATGLVGNLNAPTGMASIIKQAMAKKS